MLEHFQPFTETKRQKKNKKASLGHFHGFPVPFQRTAGIVQLSSVIITGFGVISQRAAPTERIASQRSAGHSPHGAHLQYPWGPELLQPPHKRHSEAGLTSNGILAPVCKAGFCSVPETSRPSAVLPSPRHAAGRSYWRSSHEARLLSRLGESLSHKHRPGWEVRRSLVPPLRQRRALIRPSSVCPCGARRPAEGRDTAAGTGSAARGQRGRGDGGAECGGEELWSYRARSLLLTPPKSMRKDKGGCGGAGRLR